jgi:hypothetical protein
MGRVPREERFGMAESVAKVTVRNNADGREIAETIEISSEEFPEIVAVLGGEKGGALEKELGKLLGRYWRVRAERRPMKIFAKLLVDGVGSGLDEESVMVQDISSTGIRVAVPRDAQLNLKDLTKVEFLLAVKEEGARRKLRLSAEFIRVAKVGEDHISLAFRFFAIEPDVATLLEKGSNLFFS